MLPGALVVPACGGHWCYCVIGITAWGTGSEAPLPYLGSPVFQALLLWQEGEGDGEARVKEASVMSGAVGFVGAIAVDKTGG